MSILAIDFGLKRLGLAISEGFLAQPLDVLPNDKKIFTKLQKICQRFNVDEIIVGLPEGKLKGQVFSFSKNLKQGLSLPVKFESEVFTTNLARDKLRASKKSKKLQKKLVDAAAAAVILQSYLENIK